jgi:hypothetical protein
MVAPRGGSSVGQSSGLIIRRSEVQVLPAPRVRALVTAASLDRVWGRRTWAGNRDRWPWGAVRSARVRCCRSGTARTRRRVRRATWWHRRARCRPRPLTRGQTCWGWPPNGQLPLPSRTSTSPHRVAVPGIGGNASRYRRRTRPRRPQHPLRLGGGHRAEPDQGWPRPGIRHRRPTRRQGRHRQPFQGRHGGRREDCRTRRWVMLPTKTGPPTTGNRGHRQAPR